jgi:hypothetical protein
VIVYDDALCAFYWQNEDALSEQQRADRLAAAAAAAAANEASSDPEPAPVAQQEQAEQQHSSSSPALDHWPSFEGSLDQASCLCNPYDTQALHCCLVLHAALLLLSAP